MNINNPSIIRLARRAGVKSLSKKCLEVIKQAVNNKVEIIIKNALLLNEERKTKTLSPEDIYNSISLLGDNLAQSDNLSKNSLEIISRKVQFPN